ncbi:MFS transporter [Halobacillus sp. A5]|uniref:MFS transporter n=1 Tax=Halobacillus sp. A5 TaxID=2880263 RepID=UPI0020A6D99E|nr:MFS transporter [Halobacillus sp. A5]MCP3026339.1 MFS transporter [Halobacillus sp. A5]
MNIISTRHPYRHLFKAGIVNGLGDRFSQVAVLALLLELTGSGLLVGAVMGLRVLPFLIFSPLSGRLADHYNKRTLMIAADILRFPFAMMFLLVDSKQDLWMIYVGVMGLACGEAFYQPLRKSTIGAIIAPEQLVKVNALEQVITGIVLILGSITGGAAAYFLGAEISFLINGITFLISAWFIRQMPDLREELISDTDRTSHSRWHRQLPLILWMVVILQCLTAVTDGVFNVLISFYGAEVFDYGDIGIGFLYGALGTGLVVSFFVIHLFKNKLIINALIALFIEGSMQIAASQAATIWLTVVIFTLIAAAGGISAACLDTEIMKSTKQSHQGRIFGWLESVTNIQLGLSMLAGGLLLEYYPVQWVGLAGGAVNLALAVLFISMTIILQKRSFITIH